MSVHRLLVTGPDEMRLDLWAAAAAVSNWLEGREHGDVETWLVTIYDEHLPGFLEAAESVGVTVEEIEGAGESESYRMLVGAPGTGWRGGDTR